MPLSVFSVSLRDRIAGARWGLPLALVLVLAAFSGSLHAAPEKAVASASSQGLPTGERSIGEWLQRLHDAAYRRAYTGTLVVSAGASVSASKIWHVCDGQQQMERVETLTGAPRTTLRRNDEVITFVSDSKVAYVEKRESLGLFPALLHTPTNQIAEHYTAQAVGTDRIAGVDAEIVWLQPRDSWRFGYRIWAEKKTGLVVKLQTLGAHAEVLEQVVYTELQLNAPVRMEALAREMANTQGYQVQKPALRKTTPEAEGWRIKSLLPGFQSVSCHARTDTAAKPAPMQWVFSDGLASVSLFVETFDPRRHSREKPTAMGATHSLSQRMGDHWVTAMGEVPPETLRRFVQALERSR